jgi:hypothetical protein
MWFYDVDRGPRGYSLNQNFWARIGYPNSLKFWTCLTGTWLTGVLCMQSGYLNSLKLCTCKSGTSPHSGFVHANRVPHLIIRFDMQIGYLISLKISTCKSGTLPHSLTHSLICTWEPGTSPHSQELYMQTGDLTKHCQWKPGTASFFSHCIQTEYIIIMVKHLVCKLGTSLTRIKTNSWKLGGYLSTHVGYAITTHSLCDIGHTTM